MAAIDKIMENPNADAVLDQNEDGENSELTSSTDKNGKNVDSATSEDKDSLENDEVWAMGSPAVQQRIKELTSAIGGLVSQMNPQHSDDQTEVGRRNIDFFCDLAKIKNMQVHELQKHLLQRGEMCRTLITDLKFQEQTHLIEMEELSQKFQIKLTAKDKFCLELKEKMEQLHQLCQRGWQEQMTNLQKDMLKKDDIVQKLSTDVENKEHKLKQLETDLQELKAQIKQIRVPCSMCPPNDYRLVSLKCGHLFCDPCFRESMEYQLELEYHCPLCKATSFED